MTVPSGRVYDTELRALENEDIAFSVILNPSLIFTNSSHSDFKTSGTGCLSQLFRNSMMSSAVIPEASFAVLPVP